MFTQIAKRREERRRQAEEEREQLRQEKEAYGNDLETVHFIRMVEEEKKQVQNQKSPARPNDSGKVMVFVRKRPLFESEAKAKAFDVVSTVSKPGTWGGRVVMHEPRRKVDLTKMIENSSFDFDMVFDDASANADVYSSTVTPLLEKMEHTPETTATVFAYGQTGSGKTYTISSFYVQAAEDVLALAERKGLKVSVRFFEIYGGKCFDLLSGRKQVQPLEDAKGQVNLHGLTNCPATHVMDIVEKVESGLRSRSTGSTSANEMSSRSHSLLELVLHGDAGIEEPYGKLALVDLAGSERGADRGADNSKMRHEGAEINKSLLALKECIRALYTNAADHVPFRGSRLTHILRDAFIGRNSHTVLLAHISPSSGSAEHSLNTLRYAYRIKESPSSSEAASAPSGDAVAQQQLKRQQSQQQPLPTPFQGQQAQAAKAAAAPRNAHQQQQQQQQPLQQQPQDGSASGNEKRQRAQWKIAETDERGTAEAGMRENKAKEQLKRHKRQPRMSADEGSLALRYHNQHQQHDDDTDARPPEISAASETVNDEDEDTPPTPVRALQDQPATSAVVSRPKHDKQQLKHRRRGSQEKSPPAARGDASSDGALPGEPIERNTQQTDGARATSIGDTPPRNQQPSNRAGNKNKQPPQAWNVDTSQASSNGNKGSPGNQKKSSDQVSQHHQVPPSPDGLQARAARLKEQVSKAIEQEKPSEGKQRGNAQGGTKRQMMSNFFRTKELQAYDSYAEAASERQQAEHAALETHASVMPQLYELQSQECKLLEKTASEKVRGEADLHAYIGMMERIQRSREDLESQLKQQVASLKHALQTESDAEGRINENLFQNSNAS